jgi:hypothetical protein
MGTVSQREASKSSSDNITVKQHEISRKLNALGKGEMTELVIGAVAFRFIFARRFV